MSPMLVLLVSINLFLIATTPTSARDLHKRTFTNLGCSGIYDKAKFARLDRVCVECYQMYREQELHSMCRQDCFRNEIFPRCVDALLLSHEQVVLEEMVSDVYGPK